MVRRDNIKILELKIRTFPLIISALMHMSVFFVLGAVNYYKETYNRESILLVEISQESGSNSHLIQERANFRAYNNPKKKIDRSKENPDTTPFINVQAQNVLHTDSKQSLLNRPNSNLSPSSDTGGYGSVAQATSTSAYVNGKTIPGLKEEGSRGATLSSSGKEIIEGVSGSINVPSFLKMVKPEYPGFARKLGKEGKVVLRLFIDERGRLVDVEIVERAGYGFDEAAVDAVRASIFRPALLNGLPVACKAVLPVKFKLE